MNLGAGVLESARAIHHEIGPPALFRVGHLPRQDGLEPLHAHAGRASTRAR